MRRYGAPRPATARLECAVLSRRTRPDLRHSLKDLWTRLGLNHEATGHLGQVVATGSCAAAQQSERFLHRYSEALPEEALSLP
jgi:hypothetical protein